jgi:CRP/FNR family transcriptional regulator, anaerobic regulatory protein
MIASEIHDIPVGSVRPGEEPRAHRAEPVDWAKIRFADLIAMLGISLPEEHRFVDITFPVRRVKAGEALHRAGDEFNALYVVRSGFFKTVSIDTTGAELVLGFPMGGDVLGLDGVDSGHYLADVIALDISSVAVIPFVQLSQLAREHPCVEKLLYSLFSRELVHKHAMFWLLGTLSAEARVASFLLDLSDRFHRLGYSRSSFALRATRQEIGSYLGLKLETVSRTFSAFAAHGLMDIDRRQVTLRDLAGLRRVVDPNAGAPAGERAAVLAARLQVHPSAMNRARNAERGLALAA